MRPRLVTAVAVAIALLVVVGAAAKADGVQPAPRLIADNKTPYVVDVLAWNGAGWNFIARVMPGTWMAFPNAAAGSLWRAVFGQNVRDHNVRYVYDQGYGGLQDVWWIQ